MPNKELLLTLARENERQRIEAARCVERGMETLVGTKRIIQKLSLDPEDLESAARACVNMMNAGIAFRVMLQVHKRHHQRQEAPWVDAEGSTGHLLRSAIGFESDAEAFAQHLRLALKEVRQQVKERKKTSSALPSDRTAWAPMRPSAPSSD